MSKILLSSSHLSGKEIIYLEEAISNHALISGENLNVFEKSIENFLGKKKHVACLSSGTAAIHLALVQLGVISGDEVLCQTFTFCGSANPITYVGAIPVFIDSEIQTWNMCPKHLETAIEDRIKKGKKPKAIIIVHLYGMPSKLGELMAVSKKFSIPIIEDTAEALGSTYKGQKCGTFGDFSILSFNGNKIITSSGGGALICNTKEDKERTIFFATQARDKASHYEHTHIGYNYRMNNISAGIGRGQMHVLDKHINLRRKINAFYLNLFKDIEGISVMQEFNETFYSNFWLTCIIIEKDKTGFSAEDLRLALEKQNIESRPLWKPMHLQPIFKSCDYYGNGESENLFKKGLCLSSGSNLSTKDLTRISDTIHEFFTTFICI